MHVHDGVPLQCSCRAPIQSILWPCPRCSGDQGGTRTRTSGTATAVVGRVLVSPLLFPAPSRFPFGMRRALATQPSSLLRTDGAPLRVCLQVLFRQRPTRPPRPAPPPPPPAARCPVSSSPEPPPHPQQPRPATQSTRQVPPLPTRSPLRRPPPPPRLPPCPRRPPPRPPPRPRSLGTPAA